MLGGVVSTGLRRKHTLSQGSGNAPAELVLIPALPASSGSWKKYTYSPIIPVVFLLSCLQRLEIASAVFADR